MALGMMRQISANIQNAAFLTIMADKTTNVSEKQQPVIWIRWVDDGFAIYENFNGMHPLERANADQVVAIILKNALLRISLNIQRARGQCYDGAATKAGEKTGVAAQIKTLMENAETGTVMDVPQIWLWLIIAIKLVQFISDSLDTVREIRKLVKNNMSRGKYESHVVHAFCPTKGVVRGET